MFALHPRLHADTLVIADWPLCRLLLMNDTRYPWLILVPRREELREIHELDAADRLQLIDEIAAASAALKTHTGCDKINVGALGNLVPQLHVHVIARRTGDAAWPGPVWGVGQAVRYNEAEAGRFLTELARLLNEACPRQH